MSKKYKKIHYNLTIQLNIQKMDNFQTKVLEGMNHTLHIDNAGGREGKLL